MLTLQGVNYIHPNRDVLFTDVHLVVNKQDKIALIGNNGVGKSTLLKLLAGQLYPATGLVMVNSMPYVVPQIFGQYHQFTIAEALQLADKLQALHAILKGDATDENMALLDDDWLIEERCSAALDHWKLEGLALNQKMGTLSGGQQTKVFLAGIQIHQPQIILFDEPTNHLDLQGRALLYDEITHSKKTMIIVSHDRILLNLLKTVCELTPKGIVTYGGNYDFYEAQKKMANEGLQHDLKNKEKALRKAKETAQETLARQQKLDAGGKKKKESAGLPKIVMNGLKNKAERSTSSIKGIHAQKVGNLAEELTQLRSTLPALDQMKIGFNQSVLHNGKVLVIGKNVNFTYGDKPLWKDPLNFQLNHGDRISLQGINGAGKTTLIKLILGKLAPTFGTLTSAKIKSIYIDQDYSIIQNELNVYEQAQLFNTNALQEHELKIRLNRFLFAKKDWDEPCSALSGGEKMRLLLCALTIANETPDLIILDEPTNNLDLKNIGILTAAVNEYQGTLIVVSHDQYFLDEIGVEKEVLIF